MGSEVGSTSYHGLDLVCKVPILTYLSPYLFTTVGTEFRTVQSYYEGVPGSVEWYHPRSVPVPESPLYFSKESFNSSGPSSLPTRRDHKEGTTPGSLSGSSVAGRGPEGS